jgi:hypothetical protein
MIPALLFAVQPVIPWPRPGGESPHEQALRKSAERWLDESIRLQRRCRWLTAALILMVLAVGACTSLMTGVLPLPW